MCNSQLVSESQDLQHDEFAVANKQAAHDHGAKLAASRAPGNAVSRDRGARPLRTFPNAHLTSLEIAAACKIESHRRRFQAWGFATPLQDARDETWVSSSHAVQRSQLSGRLPFCATAAVSSCHGAGPQTATAGHLNSRQPHPRTHCGNDGDLLHPGRRVRQSFPRLGL